MKKFVRRCLCGFVIAVVLFLGGVSPVVALEDTHLSSGKVAFDNFRWSIADKLSLSSPQLIVIPVSSSSFTLPGSANVIAKWMQESVATFMDFKIVLAPGEIAIKYESDKYLALDATKGLFGNISGTQDIYGPVGVKLNGAIAFFGDVYLDFVNPAASRGQGKIDFPIKLSVPLPGFGDCFAYANAKADVLYRENLIKLSNVVLKNEFSNVTGEVAFNLDTKQAKVSLDIYSDSKRVKFLMSAVTHLSGFTKLGSGHWKYEFAN
ncbi:MAG: hypothetical protein Q4C78_04255 [Synergistaceae bacterium]|nr:hypothetical protein [Synergistaceae bacterium]